MTDSQWKRLSACVEGTSDSLESALIIDSPWLPGYCGVPTSDFLAVQDVWLDCYMKVRRDFPELIFLPDFWIEYGMALEPSAFGCKIRFFPDTTPVIDHLIPSWEELPAFLDSAVTPDPHTDGLMSLALSVYRHIRPRLLDMGEKIKIVAARGPLTLASHLMGMTEFLMATQLSPAAARGLLKITTSLVRDWLAAQLEVLPEAEGILVLDDTVGFFSDEDYHTFAHPWLLEIFSAFPNKLKIFHNDTDNPVCYPYLEELGVDIFNFTHKKSLKETRALVGEKIVLMGNIAPLETLAQGTPDEVRRATKTILEEYGSHRSVILSAGGGASPGTPGENIRAMIETGKVNRKT